MFTHLRTQNMLTRYAISVIIGGLDGKNRSCYLCVRRGEVEPTTRLTLHTTHQTRYMISVMKRPGARDASPLARLR